MQTNQIAHRSVKDILSGCIDMDTDCVHGCYPGRYHSEEAVQMETFCLIDKQASAGRWNGTGPLHRRHIQLRVRKYQCSL